MSRKSLIRSFICSIFILLAISACRPAPDESASERPPVTEPVTPPLVAATHRIGVRMVDGAGEFYDLQSGAKFIPRGNNYIRLQKVEMTGGGSLKYHSTFNENLYDPAHAEEALARMQTDGYNVVRVFLQGSSAKGSVGDPEGGISASYAANIVDFLNKAKAHDIYVILTTDSEPATDDYNAILNSSWSEDFSGCNFNYMTQGGVQVAQQFWTDLIDELKKQNAPLDAIFAYELRNELDFDTSAKPLSYTTGTVQTANGQSYDMALVEEKQRMMDESLVYWLDHVREAILKHDSTALVTAGFIVPDEPNPWPIAPRFIRTYPAAWQSSLDFLDFHPYPGGYALDKLAENYHMTGMEEKPVIMGEFGTARSSYTSEASAARALHDWQVDSCNYGFDGWLLWTWDSDEQPEFYPGVSGEGLIDQVLSPVNRADACQPGDFDFFETNLALNKTASASRSLPDQQPSALIDGTANSSWNAGSPPKQWVQIDLGEALSIGKFRLTVAQSPEGDTLHQIWVGSSAKELSLLHTFEGYTKDGDVLEFQPEVPVENVRVIRVVTVKSSSWVAWREIEALAP
jgi:hypothetical protein